MKTIFTRKAHAFLGAAAFMLAAVFTMACKMETNSAPETFSVQFDAKEHGALIAKVSGKQINADTKQEKGTIVEFTATPEDGYAVDKWTITGSAFEKNSGTDGSLTAKVKITKNTTVNVSFTKNSYAVSFDAKGGSPVPEAQTVSYNDKAASPEEPVKEGYTFAGWFTKAGDEPWDFATNAVTANTALYAKWQVKKHTVTFSVNDGNGELTAKLDGNTFTTDTEVEYGKTVEFSATPEDGYAVDTWTITGSEFENDTGTDGSLTAKVKITANTTVNVTFKQKEITEFTVEMTHGENGTLSASPAIPASGKVAKDTEITFSATPEDGYAVDTWTITGSEFENDTGTNGSLTAKVKITENTTVNVTFKQKEITPPAITEFTVEMTYGENGSLSASPAIPASGKVAKDTEITFSATPEDGYAVDTWTITGSEFENDTGTNGSLTAKVKITENTTVNVTFKQKEITPPAITEFTVEMTHGENGSLSASPTIPASGKVAKDTEITFSATPEDGYAVDTWTITGSEFENDSGTDGSLTAKAKITENTTVNVTFKQKEITPPAITEFTVEMTHGENGSLSASPAIPASGKVAKDTEITFSATPDAGYAVDTWTITGSKFEKNAGTDGSLTAKVKITKNTTVNVRFIKKSYTVSFDAKGGSPVPAAQTVSYNDKAAAPAEPAKEGYTFAGWFNKAGDKPWDFAANAVTANTALYAKWQVKKHTVTFSVNNGNGALTAQLDGNTFTTGTEVAYGKTVEFSATPEDGYAVDTWTITGSKFEKNTGTDGSLTAKVKITENTTVNVTFKQKEIYKTVPFGVNGAGLDSHLKNTAPHTDGIYYIKVTGLTAADLKGNLSGGAVPSALGKILNKNPTKKVALKLEEVADVTDMSCCFYGCESLTQPPAIPNSVTNMSYCFSGCRNLTQAPTIPNSVQDMNCCFYDCIRLTQAPVIPNSVQNMRCCFFNCTNLTQAPTIPNSVKNMEGCFSGCARLTQAPTIPNSVTRMNSCFSYCANLTQAPTIPNSVTDMRFCFSNCTNLTQAPTIPNSVTDMKFCFSDCKKISSVTLKCKYVANKFDFAFTSCTKLTQNSITVPQDQLQTYKDNARDMGAQADWFIGE